MYHPVSSNSSLSPQNRKKPPKQKSFFVSWQASSSPAFREDLSEAANEQEEKAGYSISFRLETERLSV
jgi:hypothetical protein